MEGGENILEWFLSFFSLLCKMRFPRRNNMLNKSQGPNPQKPILTHVFADYIQFNLVQIKKVDFFPARKRKKEGYESDPSGAIQSFH